MTKRILSKAIGGTKTPKRLKLLSHNGLFICPVAYRESEPYRSKRGCRKHVFTKHGWYYYFEEKSDIAKVFPEFSTRTNNYQLVWLGLISKNRYKALVVEEKVKVRQISYLAKF